MMATPTTKISHNITLVIVIILIVNASYQQVWCQNDSDKRVLVDLAALPEPFTNDKLPGGRGDSVPREKCYNMMGCFEEIPIHNIPQNPLTLKTEFRLYYKDTESMVEFSHYENCLRGKPDECERYPFNLQALLDSPFSATRRTIVIIGGYFSKAPSSWELHLKDLWRQLDDVNVIVLSWVGGNSGLYQTAAANTRPVARQLTVLLYYLAKLKQAAPGLLDLDLEFSDDVFTEKFYMIGHSLGAHIAAFVGQDLNGRIGRITGLDPAGPSFDVLDKRFRIDRGDAQLVDILHTNAGSKLFTTKTQYGSALASGHIDLWANDGVHQPGCINEMLGCSHKRANKIYEAFLNHQLSMRNFLPGGAKGAASQKYRLSAFESNSFDEFHNGTSVIRRCPVTALDDEDLKMPDINQCTIPVDYVGWFDVVRRELESEHGVDFSPVTQMSSTPVPRNYYFYTIGDSGDQLDHYLIRIRVSKFANNENGGGGGGAQVGDDKEKVFNQFSKGACDVAFDIEMSSGLETSYKIKKYRLLDRLDHFEIVFPYLSPSIVSKYEIAKLDAADYLIAKSEETTDRKDAILPQDLGHVRDSMSKIFPALISLRGFSNGEQSKASGKKRERGFLKTIARLFDFGNSRAESNGAADSASADGKASPQSAEANNDCKLDIESFTIQPLRKFHRHMSAVYTRQCEAPTGGKQRPVDIVVLSERDPSPKLDLFNKAAEAAAASSSDNKCETVNKEAPQSVFQPKLSLNTVIIGPLIEPNQQQGESAGNEEDMVAAAHDDIATEESRTEATNSNHVDFDGRHEGSSSELQEMNQEVKPPGSKLDFWLIMTVLLFLSLVILLVVLLLRMQRGGQSASKRAANAATAATTMTNPIHQSSIPDIKLIL